MAKEKIVLLYGGRSAEREVSVLSAESVMRAIIMTSILLRPISLLRRETSSRPKPLKRSLLKQNA